MNIKSSFKFGLETNQTKFIIKNSFKNRLPKYMIDKVKTGWSAPIMSWLNSDKLLRNKFNADIGRDDGIKNVLSQNNFFDNPNLSENISGKRKIISWMLRSWAQEFDMFL